MATLYDHQEHGYSTPKPSQSSFHSASNQEHFLNITLQEFESDLFPLLHSIGLQQTYTSGKAIQFMGTRHGEETTTISRACAIIAAVRLNKKVLFVESDYRSTPLLPTPMDVAASSATSRSASQAAETAPYDASQSLQLNSPRLGEVLQHLRQRHDFIVIDSPPAAMSLDGIAISRHADGVILVVEAEKTRSTAIRKLQERITKSGGHILGIVLNKRNYYIPSFIYKYL